MTAWACISGRLRRVVDLRRAVWPNNLRSALVRGSAEGAPHKGTFSRGHPAQRIPPGYVKVPLTWLGVWKCRSGG